MPIQLPTIPRRRFLVGSLAAGAGLLSSQWLAATEPTADPNYFVMMADTHVQSRREAEHRGVKPADGFEQAAKDILALPKRPSGLIIAGDCAHENSGGYALLKKLGKPLLKAGIPFHPTMGNHDRRDGLSAAFPKIKFEPIGPDKTPSKLVSLWETPLANWFLLDSSIQPKIGKGEFGKTQLAWLAKTLDAHPDKPALLVAHHQLDPFGKFNGLSDTAAFLDVVLPRKQVKAYFHGHTHNWCMSEISHMHFVNLPALAWVFDANQPRGFVTTQLCPDGATLVLHTLDPKNAKNGQKIDLCWRK